MIFYGVRGVSQIKFTMSDSFLVFYDFDILSMIKRKNPFGFYCVILILNLSRLISVITILISKVCRVLFLKYIFDFQNWRVWFPKFDAFAFSNDTFWFLLISKICRVWFLKWHFWFPKFVAFDFSIDTFDFQNLWRLISQMTLEFDFQNVSIFITKWTLTFFQVCWVCSLIVNLFPIDILSKCLIPKIRSFGFPNGVSDF